MFMFMRVYVRDIQNNSAKQAVGFYSRQHFTSFHS